MAKLTRPEIYKLVNDYIGVSGGYLGDFSYRTHEEFYPYHCDLDVDIASYRPGTTREVFIRILEDATAEGQAKILKGVLSKYRPDSSEKREKLGPEIHAMISRLEGAPVVSSPRPKITDVTRREIIDRLIASRGAWSGRLQEDEFLARLYDLESLPSTDPRYKTAAQDIWKHRVDNDDGSADWVFYDERFRVLRAPDEEFLRFLCETVHPIVRPDADEARAIVALFNEQLAADGWELFEKSQISGRPVFMARLVSGRIEVFEEPTGWPKVDRQMIEVRERLREASNEEQFQAVGLLCREVLISLAQAVYVKERHPTLDGVEASNTDAKRMLEAFIAVELGGGASEESRSHAKASLKLALALQHDRTADFKTAGLCAEATASVVNIVGILSGARSPTARTR